MMSTVPIAKLRRDSRLQAREAIDRATVKKYRDAMETADGYVWCYPPVDVAKIDGEYLVCDGWHRIEAAMMTAEVRDIPIRVVAETIDAAIEHAAGANGKHGLPLSATERTRAARMLLTAAPHHSDRAAAQKIGCSPSTVATVRRELLEMGVIADDCERIGRDGKRHVIQRRADTPDPPPAWLRGWSADIDRPAEVSKLDTCPTEGMTDTEMRHQLLAMQSMSPALREKIEAMPEDATRDEYAVAIHDYADALGRQCDAAIDELTQARERHEAEKKSPAYRAAAIFRAANHGDRRRILSAIFDEMTGEDWLAFDAILEKFRGQNR